MNAATQIANRVADPKHVPLPTLRRMAKDLPKGVVDLFWKIEQGNDQRERIVCLSYQTIAGLCNDDELLTNLAVAYALRELEFLVS